MHGFAQNDRLGTTSSNPPCYPSITLNDCLSTELSRGGSLTPYYCCEHKRFTCLRQLISKLKYGMGHALLQKKALLGRVSSQRHGCEDVRPERVALIRSQSLFIEDVPHFLRRDGHINM